MKCTQIKKFLYTDYIDHEMNPSSHAAIEQHLSSCEACRELVKDIKAIVQEPLLQNTKIKKDLPFTVWQNIKESIQNKYSEEPSLSEKIKDWWTQVYVKPVLAGSFLVLMAAGFLTWHLHVYQIQQTAQNHQFEEEMIDYMNSLKEDLAYENTGNDFLEYFI